MKSVKLSFILCFKFAVIFGQFSPILSSTQNSWNVSVYTPFGYLTDSLNINGDSLINGLNYKVLESNTLDQNGSILFVNGIYGFVREDTTIGKAWFKGSNMPNENLFYDVSLNYTDSFYVPGFGGGYFNVDSVYFQNNKKIVRVDFHYLQNGFHYFNEKLSFIEGISSIYSFNYDQNDPFREDPVLLCAYKDNQLVYQQNYQDSFYTGCNTFLSVGLIENANISNYFMIAPNPNQGQFAVNNILVTNEYGIMEIYNLSGKLIYTINIQQQNSTQYINLPFVIPQGLYNCVFITKNMKVNRKLAIIRDL